MNVDNVKSQMRKGMLEYCILLLLHRESAYSSDIIQKLKEARLIVVEGTLYPLLTRLKNDGLLSYEWVESTQGPPRKYYGLTPEGEEFLKELESAWDGLSDTDNGGKGYIDRGYSGHRNRGQLPEVFADERSSHQCHQFADDTNIGFILILCITRYYNFKTFNKFMFR
jgi:PadR family transcriptional regulator, regulatory protein PadR